MEWRIYENEEKEQLLKEYHESGKMIATFCREKKIGATTLSRWLKEERSFSNAGFAPMEVSDLQLEEGLFAIIDLGGVRIRIYQTVSVSYLKELAGC